MGKLNKNRRVDNLYTGKKLACLAAIESLTKRFSQLQKLSPAGPPRGSEPAGIGGDSFGMSLERQSELKQSRHEVDVRFVSSHCLAVANSYGSRF
jgi:hypothetical protein